MEADVNTGKFKSIEKKLKGSVEQKTGVYGLRHRGRTRTNNLVSSEAFRVRGDFTGLWTNR